MYCKVSYVGDVGHFLPLHAVQLETLYDGPVAITVKAHGEGEDDAHWDAVMS